MYIKTNKNNLIITFDYNPVIVNIVNKFEGRIFNNTLKNWSVPIIHVVKVLDVLKPIGFKTDFKTLDLYDRQIKKDAKIKHILEEVKTNENIEKLNLPLFDFQKKGVCFLEEVGSAILGDSPGLGKSIQSLAVTLLNKSKKNLIVCPASLKLQWEEEIFKWIKNPKVYVVSGSKKQRNEIYNKALKEKKIFYLIINYELLRVDIIELQRF